MILIYCLIYLITGLLISLIWWKVMDLKEQLGRMSICEDDRFLLFLTVFVWPIILICAVIGHYLRRLNSYINYCCLGTRYKEKG